MNYDLDMLKKIILDLSSKVELITPEIFALKYNIPDELYKEMCDLVYLSIARNNGYEKTYHMLQNVFKDKIFDLSKYNELLNACKVDLELQKACDGILYKTICDWLK